MQIQKKFSDEPLHLEAALEYADLRVFLAPVESRAEAALFFLNRIKEDFHAKDDLISKQYHEDRSFNSEKDSIFQDYMNCVEAEILRFKSQSEPNDTETGLLSSQKAVELLEEILRHDHLTPYLRNRVEVNLKALLSVQ